MEQPKKRKTNFNQKWIEKFSWLKSVESDDSKAFCKLCKSTFSIATKGEAAIREHAVGAKHKKFEKSSMMVQRFFTRKCKYVLLDFLVNYYVDLPYYELMKTCASVF